MIAWERKDDNSTISKHFDRVIGVSSDVVWFTPIILRRYQSVTYLAPACGFCYMNLLKGTNSITRCSGELTKLEKSTNKAELLFSISCCYRSNHHSENAHINITLAVIVTYEYIIAGDRVK